MQDIAIIGATPDSDALSKKSVETVLRNHLCKESTSLYLNTIPLYLLYVQSFSLKEMKIVRTTVFSYIWENATTIIAPLIQQKALSDS